MFFLLTFVTIHPNLVSSILLTPNAVMLQWRHSFFVFNLISKGSATLRCCALALRSRCPALASRSPHPKSKGSATPSAMLRVLRPRASLALPGAHPTPLRDWAAHVSLADPR